MAMNSQGQLPLLIAAGLPSPFTAGGRAIPGRGHEAPGEGRAYVGWVTPGERLKRLALDKSGPKANSLCTLGVPTKMDFEDVRAIYPHLMEVLCAFLPLALLLSLWPVCFAWFSTAAR
jgi:hypothetical protein